MAEKKKKKTISKTLWVAIDRADFGATFFEDKPVRSSRFGAWHGNVFAFALTGFQNLTWEDEPLKVNVTFNIE